MAWHRRTLILTSQERHELEFVRDHHAKAHLRLKATALLLIADGHSPHAIGHGLLGKRIDEDRVYVWHEVYEATRAISNLEVQPGRGRKPAFSPSVTGGGTHKGA